MNYYDIPRIFQMIILFFFFVALMISVLCTIISIRLRIRWFYTLLSILMVLSSFSFMMVIMWKLEYLNLIFLVVMLVLSLFLSISNQTMLLIYQKHHLTAHSFQEAFDMISTGICFYDKDGVIRLVNKEMYSLANLNGDDFTLNGKPFFEDIRKKGLPSTTKDENHIIVKYPTKVILYQKSTHTLNKNVFYEISGNDITENYRLNGQLEETNKELTKLSQRLFEYGERINETIHDEEVLQAKIKIHDQMGKLLLTTKRRLNSIMSAEERKELLQIWRNETSAFSTIKEEPKKSELEIFKSACQLVDVTLKYEGAILPQGYKCEKLLIQAMHECLTNIVKHANGKTMFVKVKEERYDYHIEITNDGISPKEGIKEGGGLSSLRQIIEKEGGKMSVISQPEFQLKLKLLKGEER